MKLTIFGATGRTGRLLVEQALAAGHDVTAFVRDASAVKWDDPNLRVLEGELEDTARIAEAVAGAEAVISVLGPSQNKPDYAISRGTGRIIAAMKEHGVRRLIVSAGAGVSDPNDSPGPFHHVMNFLVRRVSRYVYEDMVRVADVVRASGLDWTIVRVPMLIDSPRDGRIRAGYVGKDMGPSIGRAGMADFILRQAADETYLHKAPVISDM